MKVQTTVCNRCGKTIDNSQPYFSKEFEFGSVPRTDANQTSNELIIKETIDLCPTCTSYLLRHVIIDLDHKQIFDVYDVDLVTRDNKNKERLNHE